MRAVLIVGMHRSGTSCLAGTLQASGLHLGDVFEWSPHNLKGNRENAAVMRLNDAVLAASGGAWDRPPREIRWNETLAAERDAVIEALTTSRPAAWGFKDPRTTFTLPFWRERLTDVSLVGTYRHPVPVARSLMTRNGMPPAACFELWRAYNERLLELWAEHPFPLVCFDVPPERYDARVLELLGPLGLGGGASFFDGQLRHHDADADRELAPPKDVLELYRTLAARG